MKTASRAHVLFFVDGPPVPCARARVVKVGKASHGFTPKKTADYQKRIRMLALSEVAKSGVPFYFGAVEYRQALFAVHLYVGRAQKRGDADNFAKSVMDACTKVFWHDDSQVRTLTTTVLDTPDLPGIHVTVETLRPDIHPLHAECRYRQLVEDLAGKAQSNFADERQLEEGI